MKLLPRYPTSMKRSAHHKRSPPLRTSTAAVGSGGGGGGVMLLFRGTLIIEWMKKCLESEEICIFWPKRPQNGLNKPLCHPSPTPKNNNNLQGGEEMFQKVNVRFYQFDYLGVKTIICGTFQKKNATVVKIWPVSTLSSDCIF